jgi:hypothetical protein
LLKRIILAISKLVVLRGVPPTLSMAWASWVLASFSPVDRSVGAKIMLVPFLLSAVWVALSVRRWFFFFAGD